MMNEEVLERIRLLPPLDESTIKIQRICVDPDSSLQELSAVVEKDPMLTANILKAANSPFFGFSQEIHSVTRAVSLFGMSTVRGFALSASVNSSLNIDLSVYGTNKKRFLATSEKYSNLMYSWYRQVDVRSLEVLMPAAFLMELGKVVIANVLEDGDKTGFKKEMEKAYTPTAIAEVEIKYVGMSSEEVTARIFENWNFEEELINVIKYSHDASVLEGSARSKAEALFVLQTAFCSHRSLSEKSISEAEKLLHHDGMKSESFIQAARKFL